MPIIFRHMVHLDRKEFKAFRDYTYRKQLHYPHTLIGVYIHYMTYITLHTNYIHRAYITVVSYIHYIHYIRRGVHAQIHCWHVHFALYITVFSTSRQYMPWGGRGGQDTTVTLRVMFTCLCTFALVFTVFYATFALHFCTIYVLPWFLQCLQATWHTMMLRCIYGVGWGGAITFMWTWQITLLSLHHVAPCYKLAC